MRHPDTLDKIVQVYLSSVSSRSFVYKNRHYSPKLLEVSPLLLRGYTCPSNCGACCGSFSLDFLPAENGSTNVTPRAIEFDGRKVILNSDLQKDVDQHWCRNLDRSNGRCKVYENRPMACDFELLRFLVFDTKVVLIQKQYGRAWAMERLDGDRGALCEMLPPDPQTILEVKRKLIRLEEWANYFQLPTRISQILKWIDTDAQHRLYLTA